MGERVLLVHGSFGWAVRSLTVLEPPLVALTPDQPDVAAVAAALRALWARADALSPERFRAGFLQALGLPVTPGLRLKPRAAASVRASMRERLPDEVSVPVGVLRAAAFPKLVVSGAWDVLPAAARARGGAAFGAVCDALPAAIGAERVVLPGSGHNPQRLGAPFNDLLQRFLRTGTTWPARRDQGSG